MVLILRFNKIKLVHVPKSIDVTLLAVEKYKGWRVK